MQTEYCDVVETHLEFYTKELAARLLDGWAISQSCPGEVVGLWNGAFTVSLYRNASTIDNLRSVVANVTDVARLSRAEILQKARQAKADKKLTENASE